MHGMTMGHYLCGPSGENVNTLSSAVFIHRFVQEDRKAGVPRTRQRWENNPPAHAQR